jgi:hypothetical protein
MAGGPEDVEVEEMVGRDAVPVEEAVPVGVEAA